MRVVLADDHGLVRSGIRSLLEAQGARVVGEAANGLEAVELATRLRPDVAVLDIAMPELGGLDAARRILQADRAIRIVMLSMHADRQYVLEAARVGASGFLRKDASSADLGSALAAVLAGGRYFPAFPEAEQRDEPEELGAPAAGGPETLSVREREVLVLVAEGHSGPEIGMLLAISPRTVDAHRRNIMQKLGIYSIAGLTRFAVRHGLCPLE